MRQLKLEQIAQLSEFHEDKLDDTIGAYRERTGMSYIADSKRILTEYYLSAGHDSTKANDILTCAEVPMGFYGLEIAGRLYYEVASMALLHKEGFIFSSEGIKSTHTNNFYAHYVDYGRFTREGETNKNRDAESAATSAGINLGAFREWSQSAKENFPDPKNITWGE